MFIRIFLFSLLVISSTAAAQIPVVDQGSHTVVQPADSIEGEILYQAKKESLENVDILEMRHVAAKICEKGVEMNQDISLGELFSQRVKTSGTEVHIVSIVRKFDQDQVNCTTIWYMYYLR